ncbi:MAG: type II toxin-antitoxin system prevent-host-death family antitoxin [Sulfuritalea sp.]|nr:type II toxin-antitoxin system prevent-host-death family antitoxin [Sulfuritalea sp.]
MLVAIRELKSNLSRLLACAQAGEVIEVTSHNKPIARIVGIPAQSGDPVRRLVADGALAWNGKKPGPAEPLVLSACGVSVSRIVLEDRG